MNPWLSNGRNCFRTLDEIVAGAIKPGMTDKEKALALWFQEIRYRYHFDGNNAELGDPIKVFNVYGHNTCGNDSVCLAGLWHKAGFKRVAPARCMGHCISQTFFDGRWNLLDGDQHVIYLLRDNETIANDRDIARDHDLVKRTHTQGILLDDNHEKDEWQAADYVFDGEITGDRNCRGDTTMNMTLRPNEAITWRWGHLDPVKCNGTRGAKYPNAMCNGLWEYRPDFSKETWRKGADTVEGVKSGPNGLAAEEGKTGVIVWTLRSPYVFVGGRLDVEGSGARICPLARWQEMGRGGAKSRQVLPVDGRRALPVSTPLRTRQRGPARAVGHRQRPANGPADAAGNGCRREQLRLRRPIDRAAEGANHARLGRTVRLEAAGGPAGADLPGRWRPLRRHRHQVPVASPVGSRWGQDRRLSLRASRPAPTCSGRCRRTSIG